MKKGFGSRLTKIDSYVLPEVPHWHSEALGMFLLIII